MMHSMRKIRGFWFILIVFLAAAPIESEDVRPGDDSTCSTGDGETCTMPSNSGIPAMFCEPVTSLYGNGGSGQAYRPGAPLSNTVCSPEVADNFRYKAASWPFSRRNMRKGSAPKLDMILNVMSCQAISSECTCLPLKGEAAKQAGSVVEIWQTRPDGQYSPLRPLMPGSNECRAQVPLTDNGVAKFTTVAPGSTGTMGGLGPGGWDWSFYGPPVIHLLVRAHAHAPLLVDLPILVNPKTLQPRKFSVGDFRGVAWARGKPEQLPILVRSWTSNVVENSISVEVEVYLQPSHLDHPEFCPSSLYGLPSSFFVEPISMCATSMLDFLAV